MIYNKELESFIKDNTSYIPRKLKKKETLKLYHTYWDNEKSQKFKVYDIYEINNIEYYSIKYDNGFYAEIPEPVKFVNIELVFDKNEIRKIKNIINVNSSFKGSEIKFWFSIKDRILQNLFDGFLPYLEVSSCSVISDNKYYFLEAKLENDKYVDCKINVDNKK